MNSTIKIQALAAILVLFSKNSLFCLYDSYPSYDLMMKSLKEVEENTKEAIRANDVKKFKKIIKKLPYGYINKLEAPETITKLGDHGLKIEKTPWLNFIVYNCSYEMLCEALKQGGSIKNHSSTVLSFHSSSPETIRYSMLHDAENSSIDADKKTEKLKEIFVQNNMPEYWVECIDPNKASWDY